MKSSEGENTKKSFRARLKSVYECEREKNDTLELCGRRELTIRGCKKILFYSTEEIVLDLQTYILGIKGSELYCTAYFSDAVSVEGKIRVLELRDREGKK